MNKMFYVVEALLSTALLIESVYVLFNKPEKGDPGARACRNGNGKPKEKIDSKEEANAEALRLIKDGHLRKPYKCQLCGKYHTGHRTSKTNVCLYALYGISSCLSTIACINENNPDNFYDIL